MGYTVKVPMAIFDTLYLRIRDEKFTIVYKNIVTSTKNKLPENFDINPNPVKDRLNLQGVVADDIKILDMNSNVRIHQTEKITNIDVSKLETGSYILILTIDNKSISKKFIKE